MLIRVINPNTSQSMTTLVGECARAAAGPDTTIEAVTSPYGPASIESHYDEALSLPGLLETVTQSPADGYVIACFGDPGLDAAREIAPGPVIGMAEAAMRTATHLGRRFSVVTTLERTIGTTQSLLTRYGLEGHCSSVLACEIPVLELDTDAEARKRILEQCRIAIDRDAAEVIVLGCAGMAHLCNWLTYELGIPVIDGVSAGVATVEGLIRLGLTTSRVGEYAPPPPKLRTST